MNRKEKIQQELNELYLKRDFVNNETKHYKKICNKNEEQLDELNKKFKKFFKEKKQNQKELSKLEQEWQDLRIVIKSNRQRFFFFRNQFCEIDKKIKDLGEQYESMLKSRKDYSHCTSKCDEYDDCSHFISGELRKGYFNYYDYHEFDKQGNLIKTFDDDGFCQYFEYDNQNRLIKKTNDDGDFINYTYIDDEIHVEMSYSSLRSIWFKEFNPSMSTDFHECKTKMLEKPIITYQHTSDKIITHVKYKAKLSEFDFKAELDSYPSRYDRYI